MFKFNNNVIATTNTLSHCMLGNVNVIVCARLCIWHAASLCMFKGHIQGQIQSLERGGHLTEKS